LQVQRRADLSRRRRFTPSLADQADRLLDPAEVAEFAAPRRIFEPNADVPALLDRDRQ